MCSPPSYPYYDGLEQKSMHIVSAYLCFEAMDFGVNRNTKFNCSVCAHHPVILIMMDLNRKVCTLSVHIYVLKQWILE